jgi:hypothetical protein
MAKTKQPSKRKRHTRALPVLGAAGASFAMVGGASAAVAPAPNGPSQNTVPVIAFGEEEISDVNLATFYVFDRENTSLGERIQLAQRGCRGCGGRGCAARGCAGRGCGGCRGCRGCGVGFRGCGVGCAGCGGGCGPCWSLTPLGWTRIC